MLLSVLGLLGKGATDEVVSHAGPVPGSGLEWRVRRRIAGAVQRTGAGLGAVLGILIAVWSASGYVAAFMRASNAVYDMGRAGRSGRPCAIRVGVTVFAVVIMVLSAVIVVVSGPVARQMGDLLGLGNTAVLVWNIGKWPVLLVLVSVLLAVLFWASPNAKQGGIRWVSPGGIVAVVIWVLVSALFALYVARFSSGYDKT